MNQLLRIALSIDAISTKVGQAVSWLLLAAVVISAGNALMRRFFSLSSNAWLEAQWYLFSASFLLVAAWALKSGDHVKVDLVYQRMPRRLQLWIEIVGTIVFLFPFCLVTVYLSIPTVVSRLASGEVSNNTGGLPLWPVWLLIPAGFGLLFLQGCAELIKRFAIISGHLVDPIEPEAEQTKTVGAQ